MDKVRHKKLLPFFDRSFYFGVSETAKIQTVIYRTGYIAAWAPMA